MNYIDNLSECTDAQLIAHLRSGDNRALNVIFDRYAWALDSYIYRSISWSDMTLSNCEKGDLVKTLLVEVFRGLWEEHERLKIQPDLYAYLNQIAMRILVVSKHFQK